ncbi:MAG: ArsR/SmtB family transcription factor, partial [Phycisphaerales bacterium]
MATPASPFRERDAVFHIQTPAHFDAIGSSIRLGIVEFFRSRGPMAVSELAVLMGRPADRLYHHLKKLESAGLLREVGTRQRGRQIERIFDITADELRVAEDAAQLVRIWRLISSHAQRNLAAAIESGIIHFRGEDRNLAMRVETAQLDDEARSKVFEHLDAIRAVFSQARSEPRGTQTSLTFVFTPNP